jgi:hypothetical protein
MDVSTEELTALLDREEICDCLARLARGEDRWRIRQRTMLYDWYQDLGRSIDWSQGLMGLPFSADHYTGRSVGDHTDAFFGQGAKWAR